MAGIDHYENFPVGSILLPAAMRAPVLAIYRFARSADDFADEGDLPAAERLAHLAVYQLELDRIEHGVATDHPVFAALRPFIERYTLPLALFRDLLAAFEQDVIKDRYHDYPELIDYCRRSANPVGRLLLHLFDAAQEPNLSRSDAICSALQLINHWQDIAVDLGKGNKTGQDRIYLPQEDMQRFGVSEHDLRQFASGSPVTPAYRTLMAFQINRARGLMLSGAALGWDLPGRLGLEIRAIVAGGLTILDKIEAVDYDIFRRRPVIVAWDWIGILWHSLVRPR